MNPFTLDETPSPRPWSPLAPPQAGKPLPQAGGEGKGEGAVHTLRTLGFRGSVLFTSAPSVQGSGPCLAIALLRALARLDARWKAPAADENGLTLRKSALGGPCLFVGDREGPSLSFSRGKDRLWAAMSGRGSVGIDIAYPEEFRGAYPFGRAFSTEEMDCAEALCPGDTARGAALMWAAKEAAVKATGVGFNFFDPLEVQVGTPFVREEGVLFEVLADRPISTWVNAEGRGWLAVALA
jgi:4'-phosphopantetheinyl transferase superfamily